MERFIMQYKSCHKKQTPPYANNQYYQQGLNHHLQALVEMFLLKSPLLFIVNWPLWFRLCCHMTSHKLTVFQNIPKELDLLKLTKQHILVVHAFCIKNLNFFFLFSDESRWQQSTQNKGYHWMNWRSSDAMHFLWQQPSHL